MDEKKIAVIIRKTDGKTFTGQKKAIKNLSVPNGFELEILAAEGKKKFSAYNSAMKQSNAKYKIYLDEKVSVMDKNFLPALLKIFQSDEKIGIIGTSGAIEIATSGIVFISVKRCGKIFNGEKLIEWQNIDGDYCEVEAVDGFLFATQYDLDWREDLFDDSFMGFAAQCVEFRRKGYKTVVANQEKAWIASKTHSIHIDEPNRLNFLKEYSKDIFPLVSIIIPTFNRPEYFKIALESALNQTYKNFEIMISDNSTNDDTENLMQPYLKKYPFIKYFHHKNFDANDNWNFARNYNNPKAEYVNWLLDDDIFYPRKLEVMVEGFRQNPNCSIVSSIRDTIDKDGKVSGHLPNLKDFPPELKKNLVLNGISAGKLLFSKGHNYIGEPTTALIKKSCLRNNDLCWCDDEDGFYALVDISTWMQLLSQGDLLWIASEPLSAFRRHSEQASAWLGSGAIFECSWAKLYKTAWDRKIFIDNEYLIRGMILSWIKSACKRLFKALSENYHDDSYLTLEKTLTAMSQALYNGYKIELPERKFAKLDDVKNMS